MHGMQWLLLLFVDWLERSMLLLPFSQIREEPTFYCLWRLQAQDFFCNRSVCKLMQMIVAMEMKFLHCLREEIFHWFAIVLIYLLLVLRFYWWRAPSVKWFMLNYDVLIKSTELDRVFFIPEIVGHNSCCGFAALWFVNYMALILLLVWVVVYLRQ